MEYFEIEKDEKKTKKLKRNKNSKLIYYIGLSIVIIFFIFLILNNLKEKKQNITQENRTGNNNIKENINNNKNENNDKITLESIKESPYLHTEYILDILHNYNRLDLTIFNKNVNTIKQKIYSIIANKKENEDMYKILSTIYGAFLADSMGSFCEFKPFNKNNHLSIFNQNTHSIFKPGQVTDDSEMAMSQAYAIMDNSNFKTINENIFFYYYLIWYNSHPLDIGITTSNALNSLRLNNQVNIINDIFSETIKNNIKEKNSDSLANGLLMRISPLLSWFYMINKNYIKNVLDSKSTDNYYELYKKIYSEVEKDGQLTHPNRENAVSASIFIFMGICVMEQKYSGKDILNMLNILFEHKDFNLKTEEKIVKNHFISILNDLEKTGFEEDNYFRNLNNLMGYYLHAFKLTLYYLHNIDKMKKEMNIKEIYNNIIFKICDFGGDTDTNAAIVGMIMGPLIGLENFNNKYFDTFLSFYSKQRLIYTNVFMYYFANYLIDISNSSINTNNDKVNFNFYKMMEEMLNKEL